MHFLCADWSAHERGRAAALADTDTRRVSLVEGPITLSRLLEVAHRLEGPVVVGIDAPLGAPRSLLGALAVDDFRGLLRRASASSFFSPVTQATQWRPHQPFFAVPAGTGSLTAFRDAARSFGVELLREVDRQTGGKSFAITSGIPGSVGSGAIALWRELTPRLDDAGLRLWPFDGVDLAALVADHVVVAEIYPRAAYASALVDVDAAVRPQVTIAKTRPAVRAAALEALLSSSWRQAAGVEIGADVIASARDSEDVFDAVCAACGLLRGHLDGDAPSGPVLHPRSEGAILGTGSVDLARRQVWTPPPR